MDLTGQKVRHGSFGTGVIQKQDDRFIYVLFSGQSTPKKFTYPDSVKKFLTLLDTDASAEAERVLKAKKESDEVLRRKEQDAILEKLRTAAPRSTRAGKEADPLPTFQSVDAFCTCFNDELVKEIAYLQKNGGQKHTLFDGQFVSGKNTNFIYVFDTEDELNLPDGITISVYQGETKIRGHIVGCEDFSVFIAVEKNLGDDVPELSFSVEPWMLIRGLMDQLKKIPAHPSPIVEELICHSAGNIEYGNIHLQTGQDTAIALSERQPISFIWGPPGTGKTETLAGIVHRHVTLGHRVLMLSYSNVSVDGAALRVENKAGDIKPGIFVRYGYPKMAEVRNSQTINSYNLALSRNPEYVAERDELRRRQSGLHKADPLYLSISQRLKEIRNKLSDEEIAIVQNARFVATTVSKAVVDGVIHGAKFDVVIFDEASMALIPQLIFAAGLASKHFVCLGDFRQLPPIVQYSSSSILNNDIFTFCNITRAVDQNLGHKWLCLLNVQHRMHPEIARFVGLKMYAGLLSSAANMQEKTEEIAKTSPVAGSPFALADISGMMATTGKCPDNSHFNPLSAFITFAFALSAHKLHDVGIITPYRAQSRLLHAMIVDVFGKKSKNAISAATVHQFQGSEKDVILYDAVDGFPMSKPGLMLTSAKNDYANRLFNVAMTRARGKFITVADREFMRGSRLSQDLLFERLLTHEEHAGLHIEGRALMRQIRLLNNDIMTAYENDAWYDTFIEDLYAAKKEIHIDVPGKPLSTSRMKHLVTVLDGAKKRGVKVSVRLEQKSLFPKSMREISVEIHKVSIPVSIIDREIVWFGNPFSAVSSVALSIRFVGKRTAKTLYSLLDMGNVIDQATSTTEDSTTFASYISTVRKCSKCGQPMKLKMNSKGHFFLSCSAYPKCNEAERVDLDLVDNYIFLPKHGSYGMRCPQCNTTLEARCSKNGVYVACGKDGKPHTYRLDEI